MVTQVLINISKDEKERARLTSAYKFAVDLQSKMVDAEREGIAKVARSLLSSSLSIDEISKHTGLTHKEVESLRQ